MPIQIFHLYRSEGSKSDMQCYIPVFYTFFIKAKSPQNVNVNIQAQNVPKFWRERFPS